MQNAVNVEKEMLPLVGKTIRNCQAFEEHPYEVNKIVLHFTDGTKLSIQSESAGYGGETELNMEIN